MASSHNFQAFTNIIFQPFQQKKLAQNKIIKIIQQPKSQKKNKYNSIKINPTNQPKSQQQITNKKLTHKSAQIRKCFNQLNLKNIYIYIYIYLKVMPQSVKERERERERGCAASQLWSEKDFSRPGLAIASCRLGFAQRLERRRQIRRSLFANLASPGGQRLSFAWRLILVSLSLSHSLNHRLLSL